MKRRGNMRTRKKLARLLAVLVASSMMLGSPNAVAFAEGNEVSEESISGNSPAGKVSVTPTEEKVQEAKKMPVSEEISEEKKAEPKEESEASEKEKTDTKQVGAGESEPEKAPEEQGKSEAVQAFLAALDQIMKLQENDAEAEEVFAAVEKTKKLYGALSEEEKALDEVKVGYEAIESFEGVNLLEELAGSGTETDPWLVSSEEELKDAIGKNEYGYDCIQLTKDISVSDVIRIPEYCEVTVDLDGHTLSSSYWQAILVGEGGNIMVKSGTLESNGIAIYADGFGAVITVAEDGVIKSQNDGIKVTGEGYATINVYGTLEADNFGIYSTCGVDGKSNTVNVFSGAKISSSNTAAIKLESTGDSANITGGTISGRDGIAICSGTLKISGADTVITGDCEKIFPYENVGAGVRLDSGNTENKDIKVTVEAATIKGACAIYGRDGIFRGAQNVTLKSGRYISTAVTTNIEGEELKTAFRFEVDMGDNLSLEGGRYFGDAGKEEAYKSYYKKYYDNDKYDLRKITEDGVTYYEVFDKTVEAVEVDGRSYSKLQDAINVARKSDTVTLLDNVNERVTVKSEVILKLNGKTVQGDGYDATITVGSGGKLTVDGTGSTIQATGNSSIFSVEDGGELRLSGGKYLSNNEAAVVDSRGGTVVVEKGTVVTGKDNSIFGSRGSDLTIEGEVSSSGTNVDNSTVEVRDSELTVGKSGFIEAAGNAVGIKIVENDSIVNVYGSVQTQYDGIKFDAATNYSSYSYGYNNTLNVYPGAKIISADSQAISLESKINGIDRENLNKVNITGGTITGKNGIVVSNGILNISGSDTKITGNGNSIKGDGYSESSGAGIMIRKSISNHIIDMTVRDAEITGACAIYGYVKTDNSLVDDKSDINVNLEGGKFTSNAETEIDGKSMKVAINFSEIKKGKLEVNLTGGSYLGEADETYAEYYGKYCKKETHELEKVEEDGKIYYKVVDKTAKVAKVDEKEYPTLQEAIEAAGDGSVVTLLTDVTECVTADKKITFDLGGFTLTNVDGKGKHTITVADGGNLTVNGPGTVDNVSHQAAAILNEAGGFVQLNSGTYNRSKENGKTTDNSGDNSWYTIVNCGEMVIGDGKDDDTDLTILQNGSFTSMIRNGLGTKKDDKTPTPEDTPIAKMTINGGYFNHGKIDVKNEAYGEVTINGGIFDCDRWGVVNYGKAVIKSGIFKGNNALVYNGIDDLAGADKAKRGELKVEGGDFTYSEDRYCISDYAPEKTWITGGTYSTQKIYYDEVNKRELTSAVMPNQYGAVLSNGKYTVKTVPTSGGDKNGGSTDNGNSSSGSSGSSGNRSSSRDEILNPGGASPLLTPVPQPTAVTGPVAPTPGPTQPTATAPSPAPRPAEEPAQLEDENVPLAAAEPEEVKEKEEPEKVINIGDEEVPMAAPSASWAIMNLLLMLLTAAGAILTVVGSIRRREEEAEETGSSLWMVSLIPAICSAAVFVLTEKIGASIVIADRWTVTMLLIALAEGAVVFFVYRMMNKARDRA